MKQTLTQEELKSYLSYDQETGLFRWLKDVNRAAKTGYIAGCVTKHGYIAISVKSIHYYGHRLAWLYVHGEFPENHIDHINHIGTDNRILNLRPATNSQNMQNVRFARRDNKVGLLGVSWHNQARKWRSTIFVSGKHKSLGLFMSPDDAHAAYIDAKRTFHHRFGG
jgi:hypothetical protein